MFYRLFENFVIRSAISVVPLTPSSDDCFELNNVSTATGRGGKMFQSDELLRYYPKSFNQGCSKRVAGTPTQ